MTHFDSRLGPQALLHFPEYFPGALQLVQLFGLKSGRLPPFSFYFFLFDSFSHEDIAMFKCEEGSSYALSLFLDKFLIFLVCL